MFVFISRTYMSFSLWTFKINIVFIHCKSANKICFPFPSHTLHFLTPVTNSCTWLNPPQMCGSSIQDWWLDKVMRGVSCGRSSTRSSRTSWLCTDKEFMYSEEQKVMVIRDTVFKKNSSQSEWEEEAEGLTGPQVAVWSHHAHNKRAGYPPAQTGALWERPSHLQGHEDKSATSHPYTLHQPWKTETYFK